MADGNAIAARGQHYVHKVPYRWGGGNTSGWDCSGFVNYVLCHDLGYNIPGYKGNTFTGHVHGPNTYGWNGWAGLKWKSRYSVSRGDIVLWVSHMGIALSNTHYVSAYDTQLGTVVEPIHGGGPIGETATIWALKQPARTRQQHGGVSSGPGGGSAGGGGGGVTYGHGPVPGGSPTSGSAWNAMQADWTQLRSALGPFQQGKINQVIGIIGRANKVAKS